MRWPHPARPHVVAHRGASVEAPENTPAAFRRALAIGVDAVELDVHLSSDGEPVVIHDPVLGRTAVGPGLVKDLTAAALRRLDAGRWFGEAFAGERIPTLAEALEILRSVRVIVEIKNGPIYYPEIAPRVVAVVRGAGHRSVTVSSFDHHVLPQIRALAQEIETAVLFSARPVSPVSLARDAQAQYLHPEWAFATPDLIEAAHGAGLRVEAWTIDDPAQMAEMARRGVDGIITNVPGRLREVLAAGALLPPASGIGNAGRPARPPD